MMALESLFYLMIFKSSGCTVSSLPNSPLIQTTGQTPIRAPADFTSEESTLKHVNKMCVNRSNFNAEDGAFFNSYFKNNNALLLATFRSLLAAHICHWLVDFGNFAIIANAGRSHHIPCMHVA